jgi:hypothetical protein
MDSNAIEQAKARLLRAKRSAELLTSTKQPSEIFEAWLDFVIAADAVYLKLGAGAKSNGKSRAWFLNKLQIRKSDSLLCYFHHARNTETHGLEASLRPAAPILENVHDAPSTKLLKDNEREVFVDMKNKQGQVAARLRVILSKTIKLVPVVDRGVTYGTPTEHLGQKLKSGSLAGLCALMISYLETLIDEASKL